VRIRAVYPANAALGFEKVFIISIINAVDVPGPPQGLAATPRARCVDLKWSQALNAGGGTISEYIVERSENGGPWIEVTRVSATMPVTGGPRFDFSENLPSSIRKPYTFRVAAVNEAGRGANSNVAGPVTLCPCDADVDGGAGGAAPQPLDTCGVCATDGGSAGAGFTGAPDECDERRKSSSTTVATNFKVCTDLGDCLAYVGVGTPLPDCTTCPTPCAATTVTSGNCQYDIPRLNVKNGFGGRTSTYTGATKTEGYSGSITVSCNNGTLTTTGATCTPNNCVAQPYNPTNQACSYSIPAINAGHTVLVNTNTTGYSGQISVNCTAGKITITQSTPCTELPCAYGEFSAAAGCVFTAGPLNSGQTANAVLKNTSRPGYIGAPYVGSATATCLRSVLTFTNIVCDSNCVGADTTFGACTFTTGAATTYVLQHNQSQNYNSTNPAGTVVGTANALCSNGTTQWRSQSCTNAPGAPILLSATANDTYAGASWTPGGDGGAPIVQFELNYSTAANFVAASVTLFGGAVTATTIAGLTNNTTYYLRIRAKNAANLTSPWSNTVTVTPCGTPSPAVLVSATLIGTGVTVRYTCPAEISNTALAQYLSVERSTNNGVTWTLYESLPYTANATLEQTTTTGFNGAVRTLIRIKTVVANRFNSGLCGIAYSDVKTVVSAPCAPGLLSLVGPPTSCSSSFEFSWAAPTGAGCAPVTGYYLTCQQQGSTTWVRSPLTFTGTIGAYSPVYGGLIYNCAAIAYNEGGESPPGPIRANILASAITKPGYAPVTVTSATTSTISILWLAAFDGTGTRRSPVTSYTVFRRELNNRAATETQVATVPATTVAYTFTGLTPNTSYEFKVVATNACGNGPTDGWSAPGTTLDGLTPSTPNLTATAGAACNATNTASISLSWTAATVIPGAPAITEYTLERSLDSVNWNTLTTTAATTTTYTDTSGTTGVTYRYRVFAKTSSRSSVASNVASAVAPAAPPGAPQNLAATSSGTTSAAATLSWSPPTNGGSTVGIKYAVQYRVPADSLTWISAATNLTTTSYTQTGLVHGKLYEFAVSATNTACAGKYGPAAQTSVTVYDPNCQCPPRTVTFGNCTFSFTTVPSGSRQTASYSSPTGYSGSSTRDCSNICVASEPVSTCVYTPPPPTPPTTRYNCVSGVCIDVGSTGLFGTLAACQLVCSGGGGLRSCTLSPVTSTGGCTYPFSGTIPGDTHSNYFSTNTPGKTGSARMYCRGSDGLAIFDAATATCNTTSCSSQTFTVRCNSSRFWEITSNRCIAPCSAGTIVGAPCSVIGDQQVISCG